MYVRINIKVCDKISSSDTSSKQLHMTSSDITINKTNKQNIHIGGRWNRINSAGETEQKWLHQNPRNSRSGHQPVSLTT